MREAIALNHGITLYETYPEAKVAAMLRKDHSTLKRWRRKGLVPYIALGGRDIRYFGYQIADMLMKGVKEDG
ncbi:hypothetical protein CFBP5875_04780 [Agrobacterium pusense]|nr:hypothetical protein CFBP5875_04780 [Agrobacterium pusense]